MEQRQAIPLDNLLRGMKEFLEYLVKSIVDVPDGVSVSEENQMGNIILSIKVDPTDMGKVIGKEGRIIRSIRDLVKVLAVKENVRVTVNLAE